MTKQKSLITLGSEYKEAFSVLTSRPEYNSLIKFLKTQQNNIAVIEWFRLKSSDPDLVRHKAYFEGQFDFIQRFINILEDNKKEQEEK